MLGLLTSRVSLATRAPVARVASTQAVRSLSTEGSFKKKGQALEEQYFRELNAATLKKFNEKLHAKELRALISVLPENHNLGAEDLHRILEWKHETFDVDLSSK